MKSPHVYDKAKYRYATIKQYGLSEEHAANHTVFFLRWLIEHDLADHFFVETTLHSEPIAFVVPSNLKRALL